MKLSKLLLAVVGAAVLLGALVSSASARNLSSTSTAIDATFARLDFSGGFGTVECEVTLRGSLSSRTIAKVARRVIGAITDARVRTPCRRGEATVLAATLPWSVQYNNFAGTLPNITSFSTRVVDFSFVYREWVFGVTCLYSSTEASPAIGTYNREAAGRISSVSVSGTVPTSCGINGTFSGTSTILTAFTVTLI